METKIILVSIWMVTHPIMQTLLQWLVKKGAKKAIERVRQIKDEQQLNLVKHLGLKRKRISTDLSKKYIKRFATEHSKQDSKDISFLRNGYRD